MLLRVSICIAVLSLSVFARADEGASSEQRIAQGLELRKRGKNAEALLEFQRARELGPSARATAQVALTQQALGEWVDAEAGLMEALAANGDAWIERNSLQLTAALESVRKHLASASFITNAPAASLRVNGRDVGQIPTKPLRVPAGTLELEARAPGFLTAKESVNISARSEDRFVLALVPEDKPQPAPAPAAMTPALPAAPVAAQAAATAPVPAADGGSPSAALKTAAVVSFVTGGLALVSGISAHAVSEFHADRYDDRDYCKAPRKQTCGSYHQTAQTAQTVAIVGYAAAAGLLAGGLALWLVGSSGEPERTPQAWTVDIDPRGTALRVQWRADF